jgi:prepilin-type N-terminal cleavage/methylation domain-containing protein
MSQTKKISVRGGFTFLEIVISLAILGLSLAMVFSILATARKRVMRAESRWAIQHNVNNACEFFLLAGPEESLPADLLPPGFDAQCSVSRVEDLPEDTPDTMQGWALAGYEISVSNANGEQVGRQHVEKLVVDEDLL